MKEADDESLQPQRAIDRNVAPQRALNFFIYLIAGPPIGALVFMAFLCAMAIEAAFITPSLTSPSVPSEAAILGTFVSLIAFTPVALMFSYFFGGLQAAATGLLLIFLSDRQGKFSYGAAMLAALPSSLAALFIIGRDSIGFGVVVALIGMLSSLILRLIFRKRFGRHVPEIVTSPAAA
ncbi:hypothetical protein ACFOOP_12970 [Marinicaulis aureus]|uniref:Uncharacterized protein n=1 Tax=Hyphococcus aureus TaxID=2666033 RepID=A0ABW1KYR4_9PROT